MVDKSIPAHLIDVVSELNDRIGAPSAALEKQFHQLVNRLGSTAQCPHKSLRQIYRWVDRFQKQCAAKVAPCQRGCSHCCHLTVTTTELEASYISAHTGDVISDKAVVDPTLTYNTPCPFLDLALGECTIYEHRPYNCRTFMALDDSELCRDPSTPHLVFGSAGQGNYGHEGLALLSEGVFQMNRTAGGRIADIRFFFGEHDG